MFRRYLRTVRQLGHIAAPLILAQLAYVGMSVADTVMVGQLGPEPLAAVALGSIIWLSVFLFCLGVLMAISPLVAHCLGAGHPEQVGPHVIQGFWLGLTIAALVSVGLLHCHRLLLLFDVKPEIVQLVEPYLTMVAIGFVPMCLFMVLRFYSEALSFTRPVMLSAFVALAVNIAANYGLIFGHWGLPAMGVAGCGLATSLGQWVILLVMLLFTTHSRFAQAPWWRGSWWPNLKGQWQLIKVGLPIGIALFIEESIFAAMGILIGRMGAIELAANQIAINVISINFMIPLGFASAVTVCIGRAMGKGNPQEARFIGISGMVTSMFFMFLMSMVIVFFAHPIASIYNSNTQVIAMAVALMHLAAFFQIFDGCQVTANGALRGLKETTVPMLTTIAAYWCIGIPLGYWLGIVKGQGPTGLWIGLIAGLGSAALFLSGRFLWRVRVLSRQAVAN